jgi:DNA mismatch repair ATPase MutL
VKFIREKEIFSAVLKALRMALQPHAEEVTGMMNTSNWAPHAFVSSQVMKNKKYTHAEISGLSKTLPQQASSSQLWTKMEYPKDFAVSQAHKAHFDMASQGDDTEGYRIVGQIRNSFILIEDKDGLIIVDQHAAHERIRYEMLMNNLKTKTPQSQRLLMPQVLTVSPTEKQVLEANREIFEGLGFDIQEFSETEISLFAVPLGTEKADCRENIMNLLHDIGSYASEEGKSVKNAAEKIAIFAACRGAIKFGDALTFPEMEKLLTDLHSCDGMYACAHGRPVSMKILYHDMERECGR